MPRCGGVKKAICQEVMVLSVERQKKKSKRGKCEAAPRDKGDKWL